MNSDEIKPIDGAASDDQPLVEKPPKKTLSDYTEEQLEDMDEYDRELLEEEAEAAKRAVVRERLDGLRFGLSDCQARIKRILGLQKNMGLFPDVDGKAAISLCISALARHNDERAIRNALTACLEYLKNQKERETVRIAEFERKKAEEEEAAKAPKKKGLFRK